jgi:hypothetical protein
MSESISAHKISPEQYIEDIDRRVKPNQLMEHTRGGQKPWYWLRFIDTDPSRSVPLAMEAMLKVVMVNEVELGLEIYGLPPERDGEEITKSNVVIMNDEGFLKDADAPRASGYLLNHPSAGKRHTSDLKAKVPAMA